MSKIILGSIATLLSIVLGSAMPYLIRAIFPPHSLQYSYQGPISAKNALSFSITVKNVGRKSEQNIKVSLPLSLMSMDESTFKLYPKPRIIIKTSKPIVNIKTTIQAQISGKKGSDAKIIKFDRLRPGEKTTISVFIIGQNASLALSSGFYELQSLRIVSKETIAQFEGDKKMKLEIYQTSTWILVFFILFIVCFAFYYSNFVPKEKIRKDLLDQLKKLDDTEKTEGTRN